MAQHKRKETGLEDGAHKPKELEDIKLRLSKKGSEIGGESITLFQSLQNFSCGKAYCFLSLLEADNSISNVIILIVSTDCEQVEHGSDRPDDLLQGVSGQHTGAAGPAGQV